MGLGSAFASAWLEIVAPERCPGCDSRVAMPAPMPFCEACALLLDPLPESQRPPHVSAAAYLYGGPLADGVLRLKYGGRCDLAPALGRLLADAALPHAGRVDRVIPLPLHPRRLRERGFNQAALLAAPVARALGVPLDTRSLRRIRPTRDQASLARGARADNVRGAFAALRGPCDRVLLIDDVQTTGATLASAADALLQAGCEDVRTLALARAEG